MIASCSEYLENLHWWKRHRWCIGGSLIAFDSKNTLIWKKKFRLAPHTIYQAESFSIWRSLKFSEIHSFKNLHIYNDSASALHCILNINDHNHLNVQSRQQIWFMIRNGFSIKLIWVKGHNDVKENIMSNECAREVALGESQNPFSYNYKKLQISAIRKHIKSRIMKEWEKEYSCYKNVWLKKCISSIGQRFKMDLDCLKNFWSCLVCDWAWALPSIP